jgi:hypothetical protein
VSKVGGLFCRFCRSAQSVNVRSWSRDALLGAGSVQDLEFSRFDLHQEYGLSGKAAFGAAALALSRRRPGQHLR